MTNIDKLVGIRLSDSGEDGTPTKAAHQIRINLKAQMVWPVVL